MACIGACAAAYASFPVYADDLPLHDNDIDILILKHCPQDLTEIFKISMLLKGYLHCLYLSDNERAIGRTAA
jgi:hypothetical protein